MEEQTYKACPVCRSPSKTFEEGSSIRIDCLRCGQYRADQTSLAALKEYHLLSTHQTSLLCGWIREHQNEFLKSDDFESQLTRRKATVGQKAIKLLHGLATALPVPGERVILLLEGGDSWIEIFRKWNAFEDVSLDKAQISEIQFPLYLMGVSECQSWDELNYVLNAYLVSEKGFVLAGNEGFDFTISPAGWAHLENVSKTTDSDHAFVAMWFSDDTSKLWTEGISPGIVAAGYKPFRIDKHDHNNRIDDEIIASIKRSKFLVADFTGNRGGVYFEAGFALGSGQQVIWLCRKDVLKDVHFDTRQFNHILWEDNKWQELATSLRLRIEATIGRGTFKG